MVKRVNANLPDEIHKALRVKLAEKGTNFAEWLRKRVDAYIDDGREPQKGKGAKR